MTPARARGAAASTAARPAPPKGLVARIAAAWAAPRASMAREIGADHGEPRLLAYAMGGCFVLWLARMPMVLLAGGARAAGEAGPPLDPLMLVTANLVSMLFFTPLMLYGVAALLRILLRGFGGTGDWRATRAAVFWSLVVAAPAFLVAGLAGFALGLVEAGPAAALPGLAAGLVWLWFWSVGLAEAHGFARGWPIFAVVAGLAIGLRLLSLLDAAG